MISASLAAALAVLTEALDEPAVDIANGLQGLSIDAAAAIPLYLGMSIVAPQNNPPLTITILIDGAKTTDIRTSLHVTLARGKGSPPVDLILYGAAPGIFVDLAADIAWLTARPLSEIAIDEHRTVLDAVDIAAQLRAASDINQAVGVLVGRGRTLDEARRRLQAVADYNRTDRQTAALLVLDEINADDGKY